MADRDLETTRRAPLLGLRSAGVRVAGLRPNFYDLAIFILIAAAFVLAAHGARQIAAPAERLVSDPIVLAAANLPEYALRTTVAEILNLLE